MKLGLILLISILVTLATTSQINHRLLQGSPRATQDARLRILPIKSERTSSNIYDFVDNSLKEKYWYYLTKACLLYLSSVDRTDGSYQFFAIYRNLVGTFLAITTWT